MADDEEVVRARDVAPDVAAQDVASAPRDAPSFVERGGLQFLLQVLLWVAVIVVNQIFLADGGNSPMEGYLPTGIRILGAAVGAVGVGLTGGSVYAFVHVDQIPNVFPLPDPGCPLITAGVYSFMRHPGYFGNVSLFIAGSLGLGCGWGVLSAVLLLCPFYYCKAAQEEGYLSEKFGEAWHAYKLRVPCMFLPFYKTGEERKV
jgi:protein-S-isoprenylcysteine O-methyltransferase Ste14